MTDKTIRDEVLGALERELGLAAAAVGVVVDRGIVTLHGFVADYAGRQAAQRAAHTPAGVAGVIDELAVRAPAHEPRSDADVARACVEALAADGRVPRQGIEMTMYKGYVTLNGAVADARHAEAAEAAVRRVPGVLGVCRNCTLVDFAELQELRDSTDVLPDGDEGPQVAVTIR
jgi:osmotically-inducible protein OsmY